MNDPQIIKTAAGEELVVLSRADYDALLSSLADAEEELADIAVLDQRKAERARADVPDFPADLSGLLLSGNRRIAAIRHWRGFSVEQLAVKSGLSVQAIAELEAGVRTQSDDEAAMLAQALDVSTGWVLA